MNYFAKRSYATLKFVYDIAIRLDWISADPYLKKVPKILHLFFSFQANVPFPVHGTAAVNDSPDQTNSLVTPGKLLPLASR